MKGPQRVITIEPELYTYYKNRSPHFPVRLKIIAGGKARFYPILHNEKKIFMTQPQWEAMQTKGIRGENKQVRDSIESQVSRAKEIKNRIIALGLPFTFDRFISEFKYSESKKSFVEIFEGYLQGLLKAGRIGTYTSYKNALDAFIRFRKGQTSIKPEEITVDVLNRFEAFLKAQPIGEKDGKTIYRTANRTTIGIYTRSLKVAYNLCAEKNPHLMDNYPFARKSNDSGKYKIRTGSGHKGEALTVEELKKLIASDPIEGTPAWEAKLYFLFSVYCQGMNFKDIALLKFQNISHGMIHYVRAKTKDTERNEEQMEIPLIKEMKEIINALGNTNKHSGNYVFPILTNEITDPIRIDRTTRQKIKYTNKWLKRLASDYGLPAKLSTYWARHSYATILKCLGHSDEFISERLGHREVRTTKAYLRRFDNSRVVESQNKFMEALL